MTRSVNSVDGIPSGAKAGAQPCALRPVVTLRRDTENHHLDDSTSCVLPFLLHIVPGQSYLLILFITKKYEVSVQCPGTGEKRSGAWVL